MSGSERFSSLDPEFHRAMSVLALRFGLLSSTVLAEKKNSDHLASHLEAGFRTELRYIIQEGATQYVPVRSKRIILQPEKIENKQFEVDQLILRVPTALSGGRPLPIREPNDLFVESVSSGGDRARHLLNSTGLWLFESALDLELRPNPETEGDLFRTKGVAVAVPERIGRLNKLLADPAYLPVLQTRENIERS